MKLSMMRALVRLKLKLPGWLLLRCMVCFRLNTLIYLLHVATLALLAFNIMCLGVQIYHSLKLVLARQAFKGS